MDMVLGLMDIIVPHKNWSYIPTNHGQLDEKMGRILGKRKIRVNYLFRWVMETFPEKVIMKIRCEGQERSYETLGKCWG